MLLPIDVSDYAGFGNSVDVSPSPQTQDCGEVFFIFIEIKIKSTLDNVLVNLMSLLVWQ